MSNMIFSSYGVLKKIGELLTDSIPNGRYVRFWNVYGFEDSEDKFHVISDFIMSALRNSEIIMRTDGEESRDFLYVDDCSEALIILMDNFEQLSKVDNFDLASFEYTKIKQIAKIISNLTGSQVKIGKKTDEVQKNSLNSPKKDILKYWKPTTTLENGIRQILEELRG